MSGAHSSYICLNNPCGAPKRVFRYRELVLKDMWVKGEGVRPYYCCPVCEDPVYIKFHSNIGARQKRALIALQKQAFNRRNKRNGKKP